MKTHRSKDTTVYVVETLNLLYIKWVAAIYKLWTGCVSPTHLHTALAGFALSNGVLELNFNGSNKLVGWGKGNETHSVQHSYVQYVEKAGTLFRLNPCDGTNVYTFVPDVGRNTLTPEV